MGKQLPRETYRSIYNAMKGKGIRRNKAGELFIPDYTMQDYENLTLEILVILMPVINNDFTGFIAKIHREYLKWNSRFQNEIYAIRPRFDEIPNTRQLLTMLKHYSYRRLYSNY